MVTRARTLVRPAQKLPPQDKVSYEVQKDGFVDHTHYVAGSTVLLTPHAARYHVRSGALAPVGTLAARRPAGPAEITNDLPSRYDAPTE